MKNLIFPVIFATPAKRSLARSVGVLLICMTKHVILAEERKLRSENPANRATARLRTHTTDGRHPGILDWYYPANPCY
jgi:hypothetical protein